MARQNFQRLCDFKRGDEVHDGPQNTYGVAGFLQHRARIRSFKYARQTSRRARANRTRQAIAADRCRINPGFVRMNSKVVEQKSRFKVVGAVEDQVKTLYEFGDISRCK